VSVPIHEIPTSYPYPFYVVGVKFEVFLTENTDLEIGDEGLATWCAYYAGPFETFAEAADAAEEHDGVLAAGERLAVYSTRNDELSVIPEAEERP
jgi:hypothetical protein